MSDTAAVPAAGPLALVFRWLGRLLELCMLSLVLLAFVLVLARYLAGSSSIAGQEAVQWLHAICFMLGAALALRHGGHVRVDLLHARWSERRRAWVELLGGLLCLLPFAGFMLWISLDYVLASLRMGESSQESAGLGAVYLLKALIPLAALLLLLQGLAELAAAVRRLRR